MRAGFASKEMRRQVRDTELALHRRQPLIERGRKLGSSNSGAIDEITQRFSQDVALVDVALCTLR